MSAAPPPGAAVDLRGVFRLYRTAEGDAAALQGLDLRIEHGELVAVVGPSGSGKSTLLRLLAALETPSAGTAEVLGEDVARLGGRAAAFRGRFLGLVEQHYDRALPPDLTLREIVGLQPALLGAPPATWRARADELLERVGLADAAAARPHELSGGEQQRVAVCAALAHRPRLLLADEPAGELDEANLRVVYDLIRELARVERATVVLVSHDPAVAEVVERAVHVRDGRVSSETIAAAGVRDAAVVGRGGWLRLSEDALRAAGVGRHAAVTPARDGLVVGPLPGEPVGDARATTAGAASRTTGRRLGAPVAEVRGVVVGFGDERRRRVVFDGLTTTFDRGLLTVVTGRSGSGKSTLLRLLAGLERPSTGDVDVLGQSLGRLDRAALAAFRRRHVALVAQDTGLVAFLGARENVALALTLRGRDAADAERSAQSWLDVLGIGHRLEQPVHRLSAGERQRVAVARALAAEPDLLLVDEPTSRLDEANAATVAALLADAARVHGATIVCATHEPLVVRVADRELPVGGPGDEAREAHGERRVEEAGAGSIAPHAS